MLEIDQAGFKTTKQNKNKTKTKTKPKPKPKTNKQTNKQINNIASLSPNLKQLKKVKKQKTSNSKFEKIMSYGDD